MNKLVLAVVLLSQGILCAQEDRDPTHYIMQFLAKSGTKWRGSKEWLDTLKQNKSIETNYLATRDYTRLLEYTGLAVKAHDVNSYFGPVPVDTVKARFKIFYAGDGFVTIISEIEDIEIQKLSDSSLLNVESEIERIDQYSQCVYKPSIDIDEKAQACRVTMRSSCKSKIPLDVFLKIKAYESHF